MVPELTQQCRFIWWRDAKAEWVRCVHTEKGHATGLRLRHEYDNAFVMVGAEEYATRYKWANEGE